MGRSREEEESKRRSKPASSTSPGRLGHLNQALSGRAFPVEQLEWAAIQETMELAARASACVSFGFNRSGGVNITLFLEGDRATQSAFDLDTVDLVLSRFRDVLSDYLAEKGW